MKIVYWTVGILELAAILYIASKWPKHIDSNDFSRDYSRRNAEHMRDEALKSGDTKEAARQQSYVEKYSHP